MKKHAVWLCLISSLVVATCVWAVSERKFEAKGEVVSTSPIDSRIVIKHGVIKGFSQSAETDFIVASKDLLKDIARYDLVEFTIVENTRGTQIEKMVKTGVAEHERSGIPIGEAAHDVLKATSETAKFVTSPIPPAQGLVESTVGAVAEGTGDAVKDASVPEVKSKF